MSCGIPEEDARLLAKIKHRAMLLDGGGKVAGITLPVGIGGAIGFIPVYVLTLPTPFLQSTRAN